MCTFVQAQKNAFSTYFATPESQKTTPELIEYVAKFYGLSIEKAKDMLSRTDNHSRSQALAAYARVIIQEPSEDIEQYKRDQLELQRNANRAK